MKDDASRNRILSEMISRHLHPDQYDQALLIANSVVGDPTLKDWALAWIARDAAGHGQCDKAVEVANILEGADSKTEALIHVTGSCGGVGQREKAVAILSQALEAAETIKETSRKDWSLGQIARGYAGVEQYGRALEVTGKIVDAADKAETLAEIAHKHMEAGQSDQAVKVTLTIADSFVQYRSLAAITDACIESGDIGKTHELLSQLLRAANALAGKPLLAGRMKRDFLRWRSPGDAMQTRLSKARALAEVAGKYAKIGAQQQAKELLRQAITALTVVGGASWKADALAEIAGGYAGLGQFEDALQIARTIEEVYFREKALVVIAGKYAQAGQLDRALQVAEAMEEAGPRSEVLAAIARRYVEAGQYDQALQLAQTITDSRLRQGMLAEVADGYGKAGQQEQAANLLAEIQVSEDWRDAHWQARWEEMAVMAAEYARAGLYDPALQIASLIEDASRKSDALSAVAHKLTEAGQKEKAAELSLQALQVANSVDDDSEKAWVRAWALSQVAGHYVEAGQSDQALKVAATMRDDAPKAGILAAVALKYTEAGAQEKAAELLSQALQIAKTRKTVESKAQTLAAAGAPYAKAGLKVDDETRRILHEIIAGLDESIWSEQPFETQERQRKGGRGWGLAGSFQFDDYSARGVTPEREELR